MRRLSASLASFVAARTPNAFAAASPLLLVGHDVGNVIAYLGIVNSGSKSLNVVFYSTPPRTQRRTRIIYYVVLYIRPKYQYISVQV